MARRKAGEAPQMRLHKASGRAYVTADRQQHYLGEWNSPEARRAYAEFVKRWEVANRLPGVLPKLGRTTIADLVYTFMDHAAKYYLKKDGKLSSEYTGIKFTLSTLLAPHGHKLADDFTGRDLRQMLQTWNTGEVCRRTVNQHLSRVKLVFRWGAKREIVSETTAARLGMVDGLAYGEGIDYDPVQPVPLRDLVKTLRLLDPIDAAIARLQYYCGARPGEVCAMRGDEIKRKSFRVSGTQIRIPDGFAVFVPTQHKTVRKGQSIHYVLGKRSWGILGDFLTGDGPVFPIAYRTYAAHVREVCETIGVPRWSPNQLRHNFLTRWTHAAGIAAAGKAVQHRTLKTTSIYVQESIDQTVKLAERLG